MAIIDIVLGVALLYGLIKGISKGFFAEVASLAALILGIYCAIHFSFFTQAALEKFVSISPKFMSLLSFAITFILVVIVITIIGKILTNLASLISLGFLNKILGGIFGVIKIGLILSVLLGWVERINGVIPFIGEDQIQKSILFTPVKNLAPSIFPDLLDKLEGEENDDTQNV